MQRNLTRTEWAALEKAERPLYAGDPGCHGYTDVNRRDESELAGAMWEQAEQHSVDYVEDTNDQLDPEDAEMDRLVTEEVAARVAYALAVLAFGKEFAAEGEHERSRLRAAGYDV